jgi:aspartyl-tRNA(Asn)/glutamyl-tRNA(Gln) amidotransferase subunit C
MTSRIKLDEVKRIAVLANVFVSDDQLEKYAEDMDKIIGYIDLLKKIDTEGVEPTYFGSDNINVWSEDNAEESLNRENVLTNARRKDLVNIRTKGVF